MDPSVDDGEREHEADGRTIGQSGGRETAQAAGASSRNERAEVAWPSGQSAGAAPSERPRPSDRRERGGRTRTREVDDCR